MLDRIIRLRRARHEADERSHAEPAAADPMQALERRVAHLETMVEGLQDAVHREVTRMNQEMDELRRRTEPAEMSRALSEDARERGL